MIGTLPLCASGMCLPVSYQFPPTESGSLIALAGLERRRLVWQCSALGSKGPTLLSRRSERFEGWLFTDKDYYRHASLVPNLDALQKNIDLTKELGFVSSTVDVKKHSDLSMLQEASKRLK